MPEIVKTDLLQLVTAMEVDPFFCEPLGIIRMG